MSFCGVEENKYADIKHQINQEYPPKKPSIWDDNDSNSGGIA